MAVVSWVWGLWWDYTFYFRITLFQNKNYTLNVVSVGSTGMGSANKRRDYKCHLWLAEPLPRMIPDIWQGQLNILWNSTHKCTCSFNSLCPSDAIWHRQCGKLNFWSTRPKTDAPYMFYSKFHLPRPTFHFCSSKCTRIGKRASVNFPDWS